MLRNSSEQLHEQFEFEKSSEEAKMWSESNDSSHSKSVQSGMANDKGLKEHSRGDLFLHQESSDEENPYDLTPHQEQEMMNQFSDFEDDAEFDLNYEQMPEYDVREKLQSLNAQLACEPLPPEPELRNSKVIFKDELVSHQDPVDYHDVGNAGDSFENGKVSTGEQSSTNTFIATEVTMNSLYVEHVPDVQETCAPSHKTEQYTVNIKNEKNNGMVISRGGKFQLLNYDEIIDESGYRERQRTSSTLGISKSMKTRPTSAPLLKINHKSNGSNLGSGGSTRTDTIVRSSSQLEKQHKSDNTIPSTDKDALYRQQELKKKKEEEEMKKVEEELKMKKEINSKSFNAWLQLKQVQKKEEENRIKQTEEEERSRKEKEAEKKKFLANKKEIELTKKLEYDKRKEIIMKEYRLKEIEASTIIHSNAECRKAFNDWLKKKYRDSKNKEKEEKENARITRLIMRQSRKSNNLAQAIHQSRSIQFMDFYEYS